MPLSVIDECRQNDLTRAVEQAEELKHEYGSMAAAAATLTLLSGLVMAQGNGKPRFYVDDQSTNAFGQTLPTAPRNRPDWNYAVGVVVPKWSSNPGILNSQTAEPGFLRDLSRVTVERNGARHAMSEPASRSAVDARASPPCRLEPE
jgi:hypothetical protein